MDNTPITTSNPNALLSPKKQQVLLCVANGKSNEEGGMIMSISAETFKQHLKHLFIKFDVHNRAQLVAQAFAKGYLKVLLALLAVYPIANDEARVTRIRNNKLGRNVRTTRNNRKKEFNLTIFEEDWA